MAAARSVAGNMASGRGSLGRRTHLLTGQEAIEAARAGVGGHDGEQQGDNEGAQTRHNRGTKHPRWGTYDSMDMQGVGLGSDETDPLLEARAHSQAADDEDEAIALPRRCARAAVFPLLQLVRDDVRSTIDTHLEWHELTGLEINYAVVRPLALKYSKMGKVGSKSSAGSSLQATDGLSVIFVFLVNRLQFQRDAESDLALQGINTTRAALCELLAMKLLRTFARNPIELITALTFPFSPFQGASQEILKSEGLLEGKGDDDEDGAVENVAHFASPAAEEGSGNVRDAPRMRRQSSSNPVFGPGQCSSALELAITTKAKKFIKTPLAQRCVSGIYEGRVVLSYQSAHAIVDDSYKKRPLGIYDPATAPFLDHHRLRVPLIRSRIEFLNFCVLLVLYVWCLGQKRVEHWTVAETIYAIWASSFALDEFAQMQEHGIVLYLSSLYNMLDLLFCIISFAWLGMRASALMQHDMARSALSFDTLSLGAILLCPRVASALVQDNVILLALKAMLSEFTFFMMLAIVCFSGFLYSFWQLSGPEWTVGKIVWLMTKVWLGNSYILFDTAQEFSAIYGPFLMVFFAVMANTLLLTILISLLSNTFSVVAQNAVEEAMYQFACKTVSGISSEALLSYQMMPLNLVALLVLGPASFVLTPRYLHKANVYLLRATSWPILLIIRVGTYLGPGAAQRRRHKSIGGGSTNRHIGAHNTESDSYGKGSVSTFLLSMPGSDHFGHYLSWLPLPRSRASPDRDIFQAAFARAKAESKARKSASTGKRGRQRDGRDEHDRMVTSIEDAQADARQLSKDPSTQVLPIISPRTPRGSSHLPPDVDDDHMRNDDGIAGAGALHGSGFEPRTTESPLARLFGRAVGRGGRGSSPNLNTPRRRRRGGKSRSPSLPPQQANEDRAVSPSASKHSIEIDDDALHAGASAEERRDVAERQGDVTVPDGLQESTDQPATDDDNDDGSGRDIEERQAQANPYTVLRTLSTRLDRYEQRQQRIEALLKQLVGASRS